jgi:membrane-associated HD superfamily phosphohydrolase
MKSMAASPIAVLLFVYHIRTHRLMIANSLSILLSGVLAIVGLLHLAWAFGSTFPYANQQALARAVVGRRGITRMPSMTASAFVAFCLMAAAVWALLLGRVIAVPVSDWLVAPGGLALAGVFLFRGVIGVMPTFERALPEQPFLRLNRRFYSPLCVLIGLGFLGLALAMPNWTWRLSLLGF